MYCFFEINCGKTSGLRRKESSFFVIYYRITSSNSRVDNFNLCNNLTNNRQLLYGRGSIIHLCSRSTCHFCYLESNCKV